VPTPFSAANGVQAKDNRQLMSQSRAAAIAKVADLNNAEIAQRALTPQKKARHAWAKRATEDRANKRHKWFDLMMENQRRPHHYP
jgi:acyl-CoA reductase-like NAD-dependent aldehyde dehydrogenase